ncbi:hypothetical protein [Shewanella sp.]|uniref:hypothetical protein n=1 Tax=Shewanella sp. TaxID=50422 RepID=UPI003A8A194F
MTDKIEQLYQTVFKVANHFLTQASMFTIAELDEHNPSYEELAKIARLLAGNIQSLAQMGQWEEERIALNALQAARLMERIAQAITKRSEEDLTVALDELNAMPFI